MKTKLSVFERHQKRIALQTLAMHDAGAAIAGAAIAGGMTKTEARNFLRRLGYSEVQIKKLES
ncbi:MAG TPA: hypothetical protein VEH04_16960 [Verrucomicrobiae bacterium]|nr:hypothetical protein [Verrucomicrobiae bacterium]